MAKNFIFSGAGGQGVISMGIFLASVFLDAGYKVTFSSAYGAEMRGGAVSCEINTDDKDIFSIHNTKADYVIALNQFSFDEFIEKVKAKGTIIVNSSLAAVKKTREDINYLFLPFSEEAQKLGNIKFANSVALGTLAKLLNCFSNDFVKEAYVKMLKNKPDMVQKNIEAYLLGYNLKPVLEEVYAK